MKTSLPNFIIFDLETGGFSEDKNPITQAAFLAINSNFKEINRYETYVKPYNNLKIEKEALEYTLVNMEDVKKGIESDKLMKLLKDFFKSLKIHNKPSGRPILVGHNIDDFDIPFLEYLFRLYDENLWDYVNRTTFDTLKMARIAWKDVNDKKGFDLTNCCSRIGVELKDAHGAMNDVLATKPLFIEFLKRLKNEDKKENKEAGDVAKQKKLRDFFQIRN